MDYLGAGHFWGVDVRPEIIEEARNELSESKLAHKATTRLSVESLSSLAFGANFDFIWAFSVLIHMQDDILDDAIVMAAHHPQPRGVFYANVNVGQREQARWQGFPVVRRSLDFHHAAAERAGLTLEDDGSLLEVAHVSHVQAQDSQRMLKPMRRHG